jgi:hypothetical protein
MTDDQKFLREVRDEVLKTLKDYPNTADNWWPHKIGRLLKMLEEERAARWFTEIKLTPESNDEEDWEKVLVKARKEMYGDE